MKPLTDRPARPCERCGLPFTTSRRGKRAETQRFCSIRCSSKAGNWQSLVAYQKSRRLRPGTVIPCRHCGESFVVSARRLTTCQPCLVRRIRAIRDKEKRNATVRRIRHADPTFKARATAHARAIYPTLKEQARQALRRAVNRGEIQRQPCEDCGRPKGDGHHADYNKPLEVTWLCRACHGKRHRKYADIAADERRGAVA